MLIKSKKEKDVNWSEVNKNSPCRICGKPDWCSQSDDGSIDLCRRIAAGSVNEKEDSSGVSYWVHKGPNFQPLDVSTKKTKVNSKLPQVVALKADNNERSVAEKKFIDQVYRELLALVPVLDPVQIKMLKDRGFNEDDIKNYGSSLSLSQSVIEILFKKYGNKLKIVPGIYLNYTPDGCLMGFRYPEIDGILIAVIDEDGLIRSLKIRKDQVEDGGKRYTYFSMSHCADAPKITQVVHVAGKLSLKCIPFVTEGELKADLAFKILDAPVLGCPGVGSAKMAIELVEKYDCEEVVLAFDKDMETKKQVLSSVVKFFGELIKLGKKVQLATWDDSSFKGLDDALFGGQSLKYLNQDEANAYLKVTRTLSRF